MIVMKEEGEGEDASPKQASTCARSPGRNFIRKAGACTGRGGGRGQGEGWSGRGVDD